MTMLFPPCGFYVLEFCFRFEFIIMEVVCLTSEFAYGPPDLCPSSILVPLDLCLSGVDCALSDTSYWVSINRRTPINCRGLFKTTFMCAWLFVCQAIFSLSSLGVCLSPWVSLDFTDGWIRSRLSLSRVPQGHLHWYL